MATTADVNISVANAAALPTSSTGTAGRRAYVQDEEQYYLDNGASWDAEPAAGGGGGSLTVEEEDAGPSVAATTLKTRNNSLTDQGAGVALLNTWSGAPMRKLTKPATGDFPNWVNQNTATLTATDFGIMLSDTSSATDGMEGVFAAAPATPWKRTFRLRYTGFGGNYASYGVAFRESGSGKLASLLMISDNSFTEGLQAQANKWTSPTVFSATYATRITFGGNYEWMRLEDDGTNRKCWISRDGIKWLLVYSVGRTDFLTADQFGLVIRRTYSSQASDVIALECLSLDANSDTGQGGN